MRVSRVFGRLVGVERAFVESVRFDEAEDALVVSARPRAGAARRCGRCGRRCPGYDRGGGGRRRWRAIDVGTVRAFVEAETVRVRCPEHGVVVAAVPWARHDSGHTRAFDDLAAWLVRRTSKAAVRELLRISWRTVGAIVTRVMVDADAAAGDRFAGVRRIGIDEVSYKRGHKYLIVVIDHDTGRLLGRRATTARPWPRSSTRSARSAAPDRAGQRGRGGLDRRHRRAARPPRPTVHGPVPRSGLGHRRPRPGPPPSLGTTPDEAGTTWPEA